MNGEAVAFGGEMPRRSGGVEQHQRANPQAVGGASPALAAHFTGQA